MRCRGGRVVTALACAVLATALAGCASTLADQRTDTPPARPSSRAPSVASTPTAGAPTVSDAVAIARSHLEALANGIGGRYSGTAQEREAGAYVRSAFERLGYSVETQSFRFNEGTSANLIATKEGESDREIVVGAHYDSGDEADGADDNASGVGVLLAAAELVRDASTPYTIRFVAFGAEEADDMFGSAHYVDELDAAERDEIVAMVNIDSVAVGDIPYVYGDAEALREWTRDAGAQAGMAMDTVPVDRLHEDADYYAFQRAGIPFLYFEATNWNLGDRDGFTQVDPQYGRDGAIIHTRYDTLDYLDETFPGRIDDRLNLFTTVLSRILTEYRA